MRAFLHIFLSGGLIFAAAPAAAQDADLLSYDRPSAPRPVEPDPVPVSVAPPVKLWTEPVEVQNEIPAPRPAPRSEIKNEIQPEMPKPRPPIEVKPDPMTAETPVIAPVEPAPQPVVAPHPQPPVEIIPSGKPAIPDTIQPGEGLRIDVMGEDDLSGFYTVDADGMVTLPLVGKLQAKGLSHTKFAMLVTQAYSDGYLVNPNVRVSPGAAGQ